MGNIMKSIKEHLKSIRILEKEQNSYEQMLEYFSNNKSTLLNCFCEGEIILPSFILLKELKNNFNYLCAADNELNNLFNSAIQYSKLFYLKTIDLVEKQVLQSNDVYQEQFELVTQPIGQRLINLLANIKYRIKIVQLRQNNSENSGVIKSVAYSIGSIVKSVIVHLKYIITLVIASNQNLVRKFYYMTMSGAILAFWFYDYLFLDDISLTSSLFLGGVSGIAIILLAIVSYPIGDFGKKDISGRNIVAYKYKLLLNNRRNSKLIRIFTLQNGGSKSAVSSRHIFNK